MKIRCAHCNKWVDLPSGHVNRSVRLGMRLFCGRKCSGIARRKWKSKAQRVEEKREYDIAYRAQHASRIKARKAEYFRKTYDPAAAAIERKKRSHIHAEYCRQPRYKRWKHEYDKKRRAAEYGPASEAYLILLDLNREIKSRATNHEIEIQNGTFGKRQARSREASQERTRDRNRAP